MGDFDQDRDMDLAVGTPFESLRSTDHAGAVNVLYSAGRGLRGADEMLHQDVRGIKGAAEESDRFGLALGAGDFDGDRRSDLVAAAPRDDVDGFPDAGAVNVIYGSRRGLRENPDQLWTQGTDGIKGAVGNDRFGAALGSGAPAG
jgi:hypothetical protein